MVVQGAQVALGEGEQAGVDVVLDDGALELQGVAADLEQLVEPGGQGGLVVGVEVAEPGHIDGDDTDRAGLLG